MILTSLKQILDSVLANKLCTILKFLQSLLTQQSLLIQQLHPIASSTTVGRQTTGTATLLSRNLLYGWKERTGDNNAQHLKYPEMYKVFSFWRKHLAARYQWRVHKAMWRLIYALKIWHSIQGWRQCIFSQVCKTINKGTDFNKVQGLFGEQWRISYGFEYKRMGVCRVMFKNVEGDGSLHRN